MLALPIWGRATVTWDAKWISAPDIAQREYGVFHFRRLFDLATQPSSFVVRVSADNRYKLYVNGEQVGDGPARGDLYHWRYESFDLASHLKPGRNVIAAVVWNFAQYAPLAQVSDQTGFLLQGDTAPEQIVNTGATWKSFRDEAYRPIPFPRGFQYGYYVVGPGDRIDGSLYPWNWEQVEFNDASWKPARIIGAAASQFENGDNRWMLQPRPIPPMQQTPERIGIVRRCSGITLPSSRPFEPASFEVPAHTTAVLLIDHTYLTTAFPEIVLSGGKDSEVSLKYAETLRIPGKRDPGNRNDIEGKEIVGNYDLFFPDGGRKRLFTTLWWRTWRYLQVTIETKDQPVTFDSLKAEFTAYPFERKARFSSDSNELERILDIGWRTARLCAHETYIDCPYYEQLQYVADTRIQSLISIFNTGDARLMRNAIEEIDDTRSGRFPSYSRGPSSLQQYIPGFSLWWIGMLHDYWMYQDDPAFVKSMLPGLTANLSFFEAYQKPDGSLRRLPFWNLVETTRELPPGAEEPGWAPVDLQLVLAYEWAADLEDALGSKALGARYSLAAEKLKVTISRLYLDKSRGLFSDTPDKKSFSQATNALAILAGLVKAEDERAWIDRVLDDPSVEKCGLYFRYYLNAAVNKAGAGDRLIRLLAPWQRLLADGFTTFPEFDTTKTRSDCHAWSASPNIEIFRTILGIDTAAPGFKRVVIRPYLGDLKWVSGSIPHPNGDIAVELKIQDGRLDATVTLPHGVEGDFVWHGERRHLHQNQNKLTI